VLGKTEATPPAALTWRIWPAVSTVAEVGEVTMVGKLVLAKMVNEKAVAAVLLTAR